MESKQLATWRYDYNPHNSRGRSDSHIFWQAYLKQLQSNPLRTKMLTSGTLSALQELLASWLAHDRSKHGHYFSSRIPKMAAYGAFISAPMGHFLIGFLQWIFAGRTSLKAKVLQILASNLIVCGPPFRLRRADKLTVGNRSHRSRTPSIWPPWR